MDYDEIRTNVSTNLTELRKSRGLTQVEFGERFSFSDKTISKWESGLSIPDVATLSQIADEFHVSLDDLVKTNNIVDEQEKNKGFKYSLTRIQHIAVISLFVGLIWACALVIYFFGKDVFEKSLWPIFLWAIPVSSLSILYYDSKFLNKNFITKIVMDTVTIWSSLLAIYYSFFLYNISFRPIFYLGIPMQIIVLLMAYIKVWRGKK